MKKILSFSLIVIAVLLLTGLSAGADELIVGTDIQMEDITSFFYTYENINYNADYQRYLFHVEDGKKMFSHETRERKGNYGPTTEEDTTLSGHYELTEKEWEAFFNLLKGGTVTQRDISTETGSSGPWLYLYWKNDQSEYQEFSFASWDALQAFEAFCAELAQKE